MSIDRSRSKRLTLIACILGSVIVFLDQTVVNVALPAIRADLNADLTSQQWIIAAYLLTLGSLMLIGGALGDTLGGKFVFMSGLIGFGVMSAACALAPSADALIAARALQGVAGALLVPSALAIITQTFSGDERGAAIGTWTAWTGIAFVIGPLGGGTLIDLASWRWVFAINIPLIALNVYLVQRALPEKEQRGRWQEIDIVGALLSTVGLAGVVYALIEQQRLGFDSAGVLASLALGIISLVAFIVREASAKQPMLKLSIFRVRNFTVANLATLTIYAGLTGGTFFVTIFLQQVAGYSALSAGLSLLPITILMWLLSPRFGKLSSTFGPRILMGIGPLIACAGLILISRLGSNVTYISDLLPGIIIFGVGLSMTVAPLTTTVLGALPQRQAGLASGANNAIARVASLLAIAAIGAVVAAAYGNTMDKKISGLKLTPEEQIVVADFKQRPLVTDINKGENGKPIESSLQQAATAASVDGYRWGLSVSAVLVMLGGVISLIGIVNPKKRDQVTPAVLADAERTRASVTAGASGLAQPCPMSADSEYENRARLRTET